jgi:hypothetical protein
MTIGQTTAATRFTSWGRRLETVSLDFVHVRAASNGRRVLLVGHQRNDDGDIAARLVTTFAALSSTPTSILSLERAKALSPELAHAGEIELRAWIHDSRPVKTIDGIVGGKSFSIVPELPVLGEIAVAGGHNDFVIAWYEGEEWKHAQFVASRISFDGKVLDRTVVRRTEWSDGLRPAVAYGLGAYLFAVSADDGLHFAGRITHRLDAGGRPIDAVPFVVATTSMEHKPPALLAVPEGVKFAYEKRDEEHGGAVRIYARTLNRLTDPMPRRRSIR